ncbi:MAG: DUF2075 domain-containing protein [Gemmatimonadetes bacterium]|nr:DUF2075 domain-containing protein [Gemmatimonadota bacterium]
MLGPDVKVTHLPDLHLSVSMRSFRAERVSEFVKALLDCQPSRAAGVLRAIGARFPIYLTRDVSVAKRWLRQQAIKPHAIDVRVKVDPAHWFLSGPRDTRSSFFLEDAATEFKVQGLELDWVCVTWDADLRFETESWGFNRFVGQRWNVLRKDERKQRLINAYRVLLTRARQGMVLFVPRGSSRDATRRPEYYDSTYAYLRGVGIPEL